MPQLLEGQTAEVQGSGKKPYVLKNIGGVLSCSCPAWRNQSVPIERRTCKHLKKYLGESEEAARVGVTATSAKTTTPAKTAVAECDVLLANKWEGEDPTDWWMSEKLDGVRAYWDGKRFLSRQGNEFYAPGWFTAFLPDTPLDGELWLGRKLFQKTISIVRRQDRHEGWKAIQYVVFDAPQQSGSFEERMEYLKDFFHIDTEATAATGLWRESSIPYSKLLIHERCLGAEHLVAELDRVTNLGGEGLMLREPGSLYVPGRGSSLLKVKTFYDSEATVVGYVRGKGRHKGRMGAVLCQLDDGTEFAVGSGFTDAQRDNPPAIGSVITFKYQELTDGGVPRFPVFVRVCV